MTYFNANCAILGAITRQEFTQLFGKNCQPKLREDVANPFLDKLKPITFTAYPSHYHP